MSWGKITKYPKSLFRIIMNTTGVRRVRLKEKETVIPIKNKSGEVYKAFNGDSNYAMELFENSKGKKWDAQIIDTFYSQSKGF